MSKGTVGLRIVVDGSQLNREIMKSRREFKALGDEVMGESRRIESAFSGIGRSVAGIAGAWILKEVARETVKVRGEFQQLEVAFSTMLGSADKARVLMDEATRFAATTPFGLQDVASGFKQLLAYGMDSSKVADSLRRIGDIASGLSIPLNDIVYLYGTTMTQGRLYTQDMRQFMGRGIPLVDELAKQFSVTKDKVAELVTEGKVGFPEVEKAIISMTSEGGKFAGLMEAQSKTITGQISNIEDSIEQMFNEIGKSSEGMINVALDGVSLLIENYEAIGTALGIIAASYGLNKAAIALHASVATVMAQQELAAYSALLPVKQANNATDAEALAASRGISVAKAQEVLAVKAQVQAHMNELTMRSSNLALMRAEMMQEQERISAKIVNAELGISIARQEQATAIANGDLLAANTAGERLNRLEKTKSILVSRQAALAKTAENVQTQISTIETQKNTIATGLSTGANYAHATSVNILTAAYGLLKKGLVAVANFMKANPYLLLAAAIVTVAYGIFQMSTALSNEEQAARAAGEAIADINNEIDRLKDKTQSALSTLNSDTALTHERVKAYQQLKEQFPELMKGMSMEQLMLMDNIDAQKMFNKELEKTRLEKARQLVEERKGQNYTSAFASWWNEKGFWENVKDAYVEGEWYEHWLGYGAIASGIRSVKKHNTEMQRKLQEEADKIAKEQEEAAFLAMPVEMQVKILKEDKSSLQEKLDAARNELNNELMSAIPDPEKIDNLQAFITELIVQIEVKEEKIEERMATALTNKQARAKWRKDLKEAEAELKRLTADDAFYDEAKINETKQKIADLKKKLGITDTKQQGKEAEKRAEAQKRANEQLLSLQQQNARDEVAMMQDNHAKKMAEIELEYDEQKRAIEKREKELAELNKKAGAKQGLNKNGLTAEQQAEIDTAHELNQKERTYSEAELLKKESDDMRDFLSRYGSFRAQQWAIDEEYYDKLKTATSEGDRLSLTAERDQKAEALKVNEMLQGIDWYMAFGDFGAAFEGQLRPTLEKLQEFVGTDAFSKMEQSNQQSIVDAINKIRNVIGDAGDVGWEDLRDSILQYQQAMSDLTIAQENEKQALKELIEAQGKLKKAVTEDEKEEAETAVSTAQNNLVTATQRTASAFNNVNGKSHDLANTAQAVTQPLSKVTKWLEASGIPKVGELFAAFDQLKGGIEALNALDDVGKVAEEAGDELAEGTGKTTEALASVGVEVSDSLAEGLSKAGIIGQIVAAILKILDILKDGIGTLVAGILDSILGAVDGIIDNILSGQFIEQIVGSIIRGIGNILNTITRAIGNILTLGWADGGIVDWFSNSNAEEVQATIDRLTDRNELLTTAIETLTEEMKASRGTKSVKAYRDARDHQTEVNKNYLEMAKAQAGYHGSHRSWNYYWGGFTADEIARVSDAIDRQWNGDLWDLSPEEMEILRSFPDIWERIQDTGKGGYGGRLTDELDKYIEQAGKLEELQDQLYEGLTGISFDSMYDSFIDNLMDMEYSAKDAAEDISEYFTKAMVSNKIGDILYDDLEGWWERFGQAMEDDGTLTKDERDALLAEYLGYMDEAAKWRDEIFAATGYSGGDATSQDSTKKGFATASQDSIDELNGRFTGVQMAAEEIKGQNRLIAFDVRGMRVEIASIRQHTDEMRGLSLAAVNHLADISRNTYQLYAIYDRLDKIEKNTRNL